MVTEDKHAIAVWVESPDGQGLGRDTLDTKRISRLHRTASVKSSQEALVQSWPTGFVSSRERRGKWVYCVAAEGGCAHRGRRLHLPTSLLGLGLGDQIGVRVGMRR